MNKRERFFVYTGMLQHTKSDCCGMFCYRYYKYRKWHPLLWVMIIIGLAINALSGVIDGIKLLREGELDREFSIRVSNSIKKRK